MSFVDSFGLSHRGDSRKSSTLGRFLRPVPEVGTYGNGLVTVLDDELGSNLLQSWRWLVGPACAALLTTGFGDVFFWKDGAVHFLEVQRGSYEYVDRDPAWFLDHFLLKPEVVADVLRRPLLEQLVQLMGPLQYGNAYILEPWRLLGGEERPQNFTLGRCDVYVDLVGQTLAPAQEEHT